MSNPPGKRPGSPKTGGRTKGVVNHDKVHTAATIRKMVDPLAFLAKVARGEKIIVADPEDPTKKKGIFPTLDQRQSAVRDLAKKCAPDLKAIEHSGDRDAPLNVRINLG